MRVLTVLLNNFSLQRQHVGSITSRCSGKEQVWNLRSGRKSSMGSMLMIALYLILTIQKKTNTSNQQQQKQTNKKQTSIVFLHLLKGVVFQLITLFLATPAHSLNTKQRISVWSFKTKHFGSSIKLGILFDAIL